MATNNQVIRPNSGLDGEEINVREKSLYARLKKLLSQGVVARNVGGKKLKIKDTGDLLYATDRNSVRDRFNRVRSTSYNSYSRDFSLAYQAARIDLFRDYDCVGPDTIIPLPDGSKPTIKELTEKYKDNPQERFYVYSYDHETKSIKLGKAYHPRKKKGKRQGYKVTFDDGSFVIGSLKHPFLMRDGSYKRIFELRVGDSVMPFYQHEYGYKKNGIKPYRKIYNFSKGYQSAHKIVVEQFQRHLIEDEVIHHKDFNGFNNSPENLQIMSRKDHDEFHTNHSKNVIWGPENYEKQKEKLLSHPNYINREFHHWDGERKGINNPFHGKSHSDESNEKRSETLKEVFQNRDQAGERNSKYRDDITFDNVREKAFEYYKEYSKINLWDFIKHIHCDHSTLQNRLQKEGHDWKSFKQEVETTLNHKIISIECVGEVEVYDVTVEKYANFATDCVFVKNTMDMDPIIASALDIYADECLTVNEMGKVLIVHAEDDNVKGILINLFYDILNIEHNLWSWTRNLCKYGDYFMRLYISPEYGVYQIEPISAYNVERLENTDPINKNYVKFQIRPTDTSQVETLESFECAHFRLLSDSNFLPYGKCLSGYSILPTKNGPKYIKDINIGDIVYSFDYDNKNVKPTKVLNKIMSGIKKTYEIKTAHRKIYATYEHPILTKDGIYKQVKDLTLDDYLILPTLSNNTIEHLGYPNLVVEETDNWKYDNKLKIIDKSLLQLHFKDFIRFFGFMLGDGWLEDYGPSFSLGDRIDKSQKYIDFISKLEIGFHIAEEGTSRAACRIHSLYFKKLMEQLGFKTGSSNKEIPNWIWSLPKPYKQELLFGFADADGCDIDDNSFQLSSINEKLIDDLRQISIECGLSTTKKWTTYGKGYAGECVMHLFTYRLKSRDFKEWGDGHHIEKIRSISENREEEVYDIQVDNNLHNFIADGIVVHNSMIEGGRRVWKQLSLLEDAMLISRIMRAPERRIFKIDIGNIPPQDVDAFMEKMISKTKKVPYVDPNTGDYNLRFNLQNMAEDFYLPVRGTDSGTQIETLSGIEWTGIDDIEYIRNKLMSALKIPKAFLGYENDLSGKATLASEDVRFARTIQRIQKTIISELEKIAIVHLYSQGYRDESLVNFKLELTNPSTIFEKEKIEVWGNKVEVASRMMEIKLFPKSWVYKNVFNLSEDDVSGIQGDIVDDSKQLYRFRSIEEEGNDPAQPFKKINPNAQQGGDGGMGGMGGDLGGGLGGGMPGGGLGGPGGDLGGGPPLMETEENKDKETVSELIGDKENKHGVHSDEYKRNRDQTGEKQATDYPFGEDHDGHLEMKSALKTNTADRRLTPKSSFGSLEEEKRKIDKTRVNTMRKGSLITSLDAFLLKNKEVEQKSLIKEDENKLSIMNPEVLIDE